ncbi:MAG: nucleoid-associated protein, YbaB/EbfC family [Campylobacteraceae bacterium 4484_4]|nr:MAG: nucleoid-associated protein, YbaB/EbfC family [Campylobacteraceae bacterium 4484_4]
MFENMDFSKIGEMLQKAQESAKKMQEESAAKEYTAKSGGGMVKATMNGLGELIDLEIDDSLLEDKESLQILLISAINDVLKMVEEDRKRSAADMLGAFGGFGAK